MKYWSKVRVTSWFYEGMEGIAIRENHLWFHEVNWEMKEIIDIKVLLSANRQVDDFEINFRESNLEIIN